MRTKTFDRIMREKFSDGYASSLHEIDTLENQLRSYEKGQMDKFKQEHTIESEPPEEDM